MKCAAAVMCETVGREPLNVTRNHAGIRRSRNVIVLGPTRCAFVGRVQYGAVTSIGVCDVGCHGALAVERSQRRVPITIAPGPPFRVWYERSCGATAVNRVVCPFVGDEASVSSN